MKNYELLAIFKPNLDAEEVDKAIEKLNAQITEFGGNVVSTDKTGRKKLAYEVQSFRDGFFTTTILTLPADKVAEFKRQLRLNDSVLRTMFMEASEKASV
ncbi:MAG: 30S ribosomal protein S6 [Cyanobacteria bacterium SIG26]|nr:30S ribosomal protein S6 [Cyanobacteria bacterium SIG26]